MYHLCNYLLILQVCDGLNAVPTTAQEKADCKKILSPAELHRIAIGPPTIDFKQVCLRSVNQKEVTIVNSLDQFIHVVVNVSMLWFQNFMINLCAILMHFILDCCTNVSYIFCFRLIVKSYFKPVLYLKWSLLDPRLLFPLYLNQMWKGNFKGQFYVI